jgi:prepilin-type N-terminal cleavage/methylation domain-containing protein
MNPLINNILEVHAMKSRQSGFTLVEIAIVLVIIGLLLGGVLKGQELIFNSKVKASFNLTREMSAAVNSYLDRYGQLPGNDTQGAIRFPAAVPLPIAGSGNGVIAGGAAGCANGVTASEQCEALYELRLAGFISGSGLNSVRTPFGGQAELAAAVNIIAGMGSNTVLFFRNTGLTYKAASAIDTSFDDGLPTTGSFRCGMAAYLLATPDANVTGNCLMTL